MVVPLGRGSPVRPSASIPLGKIALGDNDANRWVLAVDKQSEI